MMVDCITMATPRLRATRAGCPAPRAAAGVAGGPRFGSTVGGGSTGGAWEGVVASVRGFGCGFGCAGMCQTLPTGGISRNEGLYAGLLR